jgi:hypothetical protein
MGTFFTTPIYIRLTRTASGHLLAVNRLRVRTALGRLLPNKQFLLVNDIFFDGAPSNKTFVLLQRHCLTTLTGCESTVVMPSSSLGRRPREDALQPGPRKKPYISTSFFFKHSHPYYYSTNTDPLVHHGRHFGRAIYAFCNVKSLVINGLDRLGNDLDIESLTAR